MRWEAGERDQMHDALGGGEIGLNGRNITFYIYESIKKICRKWINFKNIMNISKWCFKIKILKELFVF